MMVLGMETVKDVKQLFNPLMHLMIVYSVSDPLNFDVDLLPDPNIFQFFLLIFFGVVQVLINQNKLFL